MLWETAIVRRTWKPSAPSNEKSLKTCQLKRPLRALDTSQFPKYTERSQPSRAGPSELSSPHFRFPARLVGIQHVYPLSDTWPTSMRLVVPSNLLPLPISISKPIRPDFLYPRVWFNGVRKEIRATRRRASRAFSPLLSSPLLSSGILFPSSSPLEGSD